MTKGSLFLLDLLHDLFICLSYLVLVVVDIRAEKSNVQDLFVRRTDTRYRIDYPIRGYVKLLTRKSECIQD
jgi:hypothetical protein